MVASRYQGFRNVTVFSVGMMGLALMGAIAQGGERQNVWAKTEQQKTELAAKAELEQARAEQQRKISEAYEQNKILPVASMLLLDYELGASPPEMDYYASVDPSKKTQIFDKNRRYAGCAFEGRFYFVKTEPNVPCEETP